jgi:death-on-curing protein
MNHPFVDGNKRVGLEASLIFLEVNDESLIADDEELVDLVLKTTAGQVGKREIAEFFRSHCK